MTIHDVKLRWKQSILTVAAALGILAVGAAGIGDLARSITDERRNQAREMVEVAIHLIRHIESEAAAGRLSRLDAQEWAKRELRNLGFGGSGYFWVIDTRSRMVVHPILPHLEDTDLATGTDPHGQIVAAAALQTTTESGSGFIRYRWPKPGSDSAVHKVSFVSLYAPWGWIVGTGIYLEDVREMLWTRTAFVGGIALAVLAVLLAGSMWIARGITGPLAAITRNLVLLTEGKFSGPLHEPERRDEIGDLARAFNFFRRKTQEMERLRIEKEIAQDRERQTLREGEGRYRMLLEQSPDAMLIYRNDQIIYANNVAVSLFNATGPEQLVGLAIDSLFAPSDQEKARSLRQNVLVSGWAMPLTEGNYRRLNGEEFIAEATASRVHVDNAYAVHTVIRDVTERKRSEETFRKLSKVVEQSPSLVIITDAAANIEYVNPKFEDVSGYALADVFGKNPGFLKSGNTADAVYQNLWHTLKQGREWRGEFCNKKKDGSLFWEYAIISPIKAEDGQITHYVAVKEDITVRKAYEECLTHQAHHDALTDLPNRTLAMDRLSQALKRARHDQRLVALMCVGIDDFKRINGTFGHAAGDDVLIEVANRLRSVVEDGVTVARLEGDVFAIILPSIEASIYAEVAGRRVIGALTEPFFIDNQEIVLTASVGQTLFPSDGTDAQVLLRNAQSALQRAKTAGRNTFRYFTPHMNVDARRRIQMQSLLRRAIENDELSVLYQPVVEASTRRWIGAEALMRWNNPQLGPIPPTEFIPLAEESDLIVHLGEWILAKACRQAVEWNRSAGTELHMAVNVSARQLRDVSFAETVARILQETSLPPNLLELELTERLLVGRGTENGRIIDVLDGMGIRFSIDDFGTGYSALTYLKQFPTKILKIDRSFIRNLGSSEKDAALVRAMIAMAHCLGINVIGEGVETPGQAMILHAAGCNFFQGYLYGKPMPADDFAAGLVRERGTTAIG
ncbi:MAG: EAL domain-containing protein [Rhodospirillales bacterium]|jgi:diguanylate cyclase (GGDEF)-like protein/PAS domain S-box-containing protein|nr:EAL domain-containing protein [Rhodospirillales bacterium]